MKKHVETTPGVSLFDIFRNAVFDVVLAIKYAIKEKDDQLVDLINKLITKLELEDTEKSILGKMFANLLIKAKNICEAKLSLEGIFVTFEFWHFVKRI